MEKKLIGITEYMCTYCGKKSKRHKGEGRPLPGTCHRRNGNLPHRWVKNREI